MSKRSVKGRCYKWREIGQLVGHEPCGYLTQVGQNIVCGCFRKDLNPNAPSIVLPGVKEPQWLSKALLFQQQGTPIPIFVKSKSSQWEFVGQFQVEALTQNSIEIQIHRERYHLNDIGAVMFLSEGKYLSPGFFSACKKNEIAPTRFILAVNIAEQTVSLYEIVRSSAFRRPEPAKAGTPNDYKFVKQFSCSTSRFGTGQTEGSNCTPLGLHRIAEKIGAGKPAGTVFKSREVVGHTSQPKFVDAKITTRILWLDGLEPGFNRGGNVDSRSRYIYIHGTGDETTLGRPASCGCIHLSANDLVPLFDKLPGGTLVWISER